MDWLNENTGEGVHFFGVELQVVKIGNSPSAPLLNLVVQPNDWQKRVRAATQRGAVTGKVALYLQFWPKLLDRFVPSIRVGLALAASARKHTPA